MLEHSFIKTTLWSWGDDSVGKNACCRSMRTCLQYQTNTPGIPAPESRGKGISWAHWPDTTAESVSPSSWRNLSPNKKVKCLKGYLMLTSNPTHVHVCTHANIYTCVHSCKSLLWLALRHRHVILTRRFNIILKMGCVEKKAELMGLQRPEPWL